MQLFIITCSCGKKVSFENKSTGCYNVGDVIKASGWYPIMQQGGDLFWLCPDCAAQVIELASKIIEIVGHGDFYVRAAQ